MKSGGDHRCESTFHVLRTATINSPVFFDRVERRIHADNADGVHMSTEHQRPALLPAFKDTDNVRTAWSDLLNLDVESGGMQFCRNDAADFVFAGSARNERRVHRIDGDQIPEQIDGGI